MIIAIALFVDMFRLSEFYICKSFCWPCCWNASITFPEGGPLRLQSLAVLFFYRLLSDKLQCALWRQALCLSLYGKNSSLQMQFLLLRLNIFISSIYPWK